MPDSSPPSQQPRPGSAAPGGEGTPVLCGARLADGRTVDVRLGSGRILAVGTAGSLAGEAGGWGARVDLGGYLLLPAPAEPHAHFDTALTAAEGADAVGGAGVAGGAVGEVAGVAADDRSRAPGPSGPADPSDPSGPSGPADSAGFSGFSDCSGVSGADVQRRAVEAALLQLGHGATALRTHVRIGGGAGLDRLGALRAARAALRGLADVAVVAAAPPVLTGAAGADGRALLHEAVAMGATALGGCPDLDPDPAGCTETLLRVAAEYGCAVDLHSDGADPARLDRVAAVAGDLRCGAGVAVGPCGGLARVPYETAAGVAQRLAGAGVAVVCLPQGDCGAAREAGRGGAWGGPVRGAVAQPFSHAPVRLLRAAGVRVAAGSGAVRDAANPVGRGDPLQSAYVLAATGEAAPVAAYEAVAGQARAVLGLPEVRVEAGFPAELLAVRGDSIAGALSLGYSRIVIHRGRVVARTSAVREYCDSGAAELDLPRQGLRRTAG
ncbi:hydrolase [Streptomyces synnematoformans]|uniref:Hydrolase n=1 Tax=Streptomyces synnematoformans TaxID=415721 RepID=A0ABN2YL58_9ACTN